MNDYLQGCVVGFCSLHLGLMIANRLIYGEWFPVLYSQRRVQNMLAEQRRRDRHQPLREAYEALTREVRSRT